MREYHSEEHFKKKMRIFFQKDRKRYTILLKKMQEILSCDDVAHYKNLRAPLHYLKRVHIDSHFVLVFRYDATTDTIFFYDIDHHDAIYK
jgi:mRNA-degrading endonuclease RelE of RelBE toxin-antitoxin system